MKWAKLALILVLFLLLASCQQPTNEEIYYKAQKKLSELKAYQCTATIIVQRENEKKEYVFQQTFQYPDHYRLEVISPEELKGNVTLSNGKTAWVYHPSINQYWRLEPFDQSQEQLMFVGYFMKNLLNSEEATLQQEKIEGRDYIVITSPLPGGNSYFHQQRLWVDSQALIPYSLEIIDEKASVRFKVFYEDFTFNPELEEGFFHLNYNN